MTSLIAAAAFFVLLHLLVSGTRLRAAIVGTVGEGPYMALFSLASLGGIVWLSMAYGDARGFGETWWDTGAAGRCAAPVVMSTSSCAGCCVAPPKRARAPEGARSPASPKEKVSRPSAPGCRPA